MTLVESLPPGPPGATNQVVPLPMTAHDRQRVRRRITAPDGREIALSLRTGTRLRHGQVVHREAGRVYVVEAQPEQVLVLRPRSRREAAFIGHLIGNLHREIELDGDAICVLFDVVLEQRLANEGLNVRREERPFYASAPGEHSH